MNVMAQAHKMVKALIAKLSPSARYKGQYAKMLSVALKQVHTEYKAMQAAKNDQIQDMIFQANTFIAKMEGYLPLAKGYVVTVGAHRICTNAEVGTVEHILKMPNYVNIEDAQYYASRVRNGNNESGQVEVWADRIRWEIQEQKELIKTLQNA